MEMVVLTASCVRGVSEGSLGTVYEEVQVVHIPMKCYKVTWFRSFSDICSNTVQVDSSYHNILYYDQLVSSELQSTARTCLIICMIGYTSVVSTCDARNSGWRSGGASIASAVSSESSCFPLIQPLMHDAKPAKPELKRSRGSLG